MRCIDFAGIRAVSRSSGQIRRAKRSSSPPGNISIHIQRTVEYAEDGDVSVHAMKMGDAVMTVEKDANNALRLRSVFMANLRKIFQNLGAPINFGYDLSGCDGIVPAYVVMDICEPAFGLVRPRYFCHD